MRRSIIALVAFCGVLAAAPGRVGADDRPDAARKSASAPARPGRADKADEKDEDAVPRALIDAARRSFVVVRFHFRKDTSETPQAAERDYRIARIYGEYVDNKRPAELPGLVLDDKGHVLVADGGLEDRFIERIEVESGGEVYPAKRASLLFQAPGIVLKAGGDAAGKLTPVKFQPLEDKGVNTRLLQATLVKVDEEWRLRFAPLRPSVRLTGGGKENVFYGTRSAMRYASRYGTGEYGMGLVADEDGAAVGCVTTPFLDLQQAECLWKGPEILKAKGMAWEAFSRAERTCREQLIRAVQEVVLVLREGADAGGSSLYRSRASGQAAGREVSAYGLAVSETEIVVLKGIDSKLARQIDRIYLKHSPTRREELQFVGAYKTIGGFVLRLATGKLPARVRLAAADPQRMRPLWMARLRKRFGRKYVDLSTNRLYGKARGYKGEYHWSAARTIPPGTFLVDLTGRLIGAYAHERREHEEERRLETARSYRSPTASYRIFAVSELRDLLTSPAAHVDPKIAVKSKTLAKRRAWLGVEYVPMTGDLAEMLKIEQPTKDGQLGFLINAVYASSPAEKINLQVGDILLTLQAPGMPYPIQLASRLARAGRGYSGRWYSSSDDEEGGPLAPTWKARLNFLTRAMDAIGVGKTVRLTYFHPAAGSGAGKAVTVDYKIQLAPPDVASAAKWKNRKLGLTVKDVTYEVRHALNLKGPAPGVLVAKIEHGSPTDIAKIYPNEIITRLDDEPLASARRMRDLIATARKARKDKVRLTILRLGKTRFADLAVTEYDPADDEGVDAAP